MAIYTKPSDSSTARLTEAPIYGSSRIGVARLGSLYSSSTSHTAPTLGTVLPRITGARSYELTDHLGNVRATISDIAVKHGTEWDAELVTRTDYYPFGMIMDGRNEASGEHRYGYNGKENDNEVKGDGNQQDYGFRIYDPRAARFLSVDPLAPEYPSWSPYPFAMDRPIDGVDLDGKEWSSVKTVDRQGKVLSIVYTAKIKVLNSSAIADEEHKLIAQGIASSIESRFSGQTAEGVRIKVNVQLEYVNSIQAQDYALEFVDIVRLPNGSSHPRLVGLTRSMGNSQSNRIQVLANQSSTEAVLTGTHEVGHTLGLRHENDALNPNAIRQVVTRRNIMHSSAPNTNDIHPLQRSAIDATIPTQTTLPSLTPVVKDNTNVQLPPR